MPLAHCPPLDFFGFGRLDYHYLTCLSHQLVLFLLADAALMRHIEDENLGNRLQRTEGSGVREDAA